MTTRPPTQKPNAFGPIRDMPDGDGVCPICGAEVTLRRDVLRRAVLLERALQVGMDTRGYERRFYAYHFCNLAALAEVLREQEGLGGGDEEELELRRKLVLSLVRLMDKAELTNAQRGAVLGKLTDEAKVRLPDYAPPHFLLDRLMRLVRWHEERGDEGLRAAANAWIAERDKRIPPRMR